MTTLSVERMPPRSGHSPWLSIAFFWGSVAFHVVGFIALTHWIEAQPKAAVQKPVELVFFEVEKPKPPPPPEPEPPKVEEVKPPPVKLKVKPPPVKVAEQKAPPPPVDAPPPPNETPPPQTPPSKPVPIITGISMSSTTAGGAFAAPVGNTMYGKNPTVATSPADVKAYVAPKYVPPSQVDESPSVLSQPKIAYPPQAKSLDVEGQVILRIVIDAEGRVISAKVLKGPGFGLNEAALAGIKGFKFKPATKNGEKVATEMDYTYTFLLD